MLRLPTENEFSWPHFPHENYPTFCSPLQQSFSKAVVNNLCLQSSPAASPSTHSNRASVAIATRPTWHSPVFTKATDDLHGPSLRVSVSPHRAQPIRLLDTTQCSLLLRRFRVAATPPHPGVPPLAGCSLSISLAGASFSPAANRAGMSLDPIFKSSANEQTPSDLIPLNTSHGQKTPLHLQLRPLASPSGLGRPALRVSTGVSHNLELNMFKTELLPLFVHKPSPPGACPISVGGNSIYLHKLKSVTSIQTSPFFSQPIPILPGYQGICLQSTSRM